VTARAHRETPRHPPQARPHPRYWQTTSLALLVSLALLTGENASGAQKSKPRPQQVVISGMVFTEKGYSLPGASIRVNRAGERKTRWEAMSDRQGEFGLWVPQGGEYEVHVKAKGFEEQVQKVDGKTGTREKLVFRMTSAAPEKKPSS
jgi:hypothetical protein